MDRNADLEHALAFVINRIPEPTAFFIQRAMISKRSASCWSVINARFAFPVPAQIKWQLDVVGEKSETSSSVQSIGGYRLHHRGL